MLVSVMVSSSSQRKAVYCCITRYPTHMRLLWRCQQYRTFEVGKSFMRMQKGSYISCSEIYLLSHKKFALLMFNLHFSHRISDNVSEIAQKSTAVTFPSILSMVSFPIHPLDQTPLYVYTESSIRTSTSSMFSVQISVSSNMLEKKASCGIRPPHFFVSLSQSTSADRRASSSVVSGS